jgi:hypothetical protein
MSAMANAVRHHAARRVITTIRLVHDGGEIRLDMRDRWYHRWTVWGFYPTIAAAAEATPAALRVARRKPEPEWGWRP